METDFKYQWTIDPVLPLQAIVLIGVLLLLLTGYTYYTVAKPIGLGKNACLFALRILGSVLVVMTLLEVSLEYEVPPSKLEKQTLVALDTSRSMLQRDGGETSRFEKGVHMIEEAGLLEDNASGTGASRLRFFGFDEGASDLTPDVLPEMEPEGRTTWFHRSINRIIQSLPAGQEANALILISDGHDFELVNPARTGRDARNRNIPIYALKVGEEGFVRDVSVSMASYQPYSYAKQLSKLKTNIRVIGCEYEELTVRLFREGQAVDAKRLRVDTQQQLSVEFEVKEEEVGQFEYEVVVDALEFESNTGNNTTMSYLNVIDRKINVLVLEGNPYWDTSFVQRSLMRNDKINVDAFIKYTDSKIRKLRKEENGFPLEKIPDTVEAFTAYDIILLGRGVDRLLNESAQEALVTYVQEHGGNVIFARGQAFEGNATDKALQPVDWGDWVEEPMALSVARAGHSIAPLRVLADELVEKGSLPRVLAGRKMQAKKTLASVLAEGRNDVGDQKVTAVVHRRSGSGQAVSIGVEGLWHLAFHPDVEEVNNVFDRFWDQTILWLLSGSDFLKDEDFSFNTSAANLVLGQKLYLRLFAKDESKLPQSLPVAVSLDGEPFTRIQLNPRESKRSMLMGEFAATAVGKYELSYTLPDGSHHQSRFMVHDENLEETEVTSDEAYLKRLAEASGGRLIVADELKKLFEQFQSQEIDTLPKSKTERAWDQAWIFYTIAACFALDWLLRRRWGLS